MQFQLTPRLGLINFTHVFHFLLNRYLLPNRHFLWTVEHVALEKRTKNVVSSVLHRAWQHKRIKQIRIFYNGNNHFSYNLISLQLLLLDNIDSETETISYAHDLSKKLFLTWHRYYFLLILNNCKNVQSCSSMLCAFS